MRLKTLNSDFKLNDSGTIRGTLFNSYTIFKKFAIIRLIDKKILYLIIKKT